MQKRTTKVALLAVLAIVLVLGICTAALADQTWADLPDSVSAKYGVTDNQIAAISEGYSNGLWRPFSTVSRAQFTKMAVAAFNIPLASPPIASYMDVTKSNYYYPYIEGAKAAGVVTGTTATTFSPNVKITRQQAIAIVARYIAKAQGFDLATMYSTEEISKLLAHFGDAASISADLRDEVAFAFDMGLTQGDDYGNINPLTNLTRIQGAALLVRAQAIVPPNLWVPAKIELVSTDKSEGLIGQAYVATFRVTTGDGHPAKGVLVDFDSQMADFYVGNVDPEAKVTDGNGEVTVGLLSLEPGVQRVSAQVAGLPLIYTTRYWLALDEVYNTKGAAAQNNAGVEHQWAVRVVVFGPGPRSTSVSDWYNAIDASFDPTNVNVEDGIDANEWYFDTVHVTIEDWNKTFEDYLAGLGYKPRTLSGVDVEWAIYNKLDNPKTTLTNEAVTSVGNIIKVDGTAITPAKTAVGKTNADGLSTITVYSEATGVTLTEAVADYVGNPYPEQLFDHLTFENELWWHNFDWDDQPTVNATQTKTWISHTLSGGDNSGPISPSYQAPNVGEEKTLVLTLLDTYGNPIAGKGVEWYMQGVGFFQTDDSGDTSDPNVAANNVDYDVTDAAGKAKVFVKSYDSGEQIVHAKVRDKGTGGAEGTWTTYTAEVQWFDVDIATFDDITTQYGWSTPYTDTRKWVYLNEALSTNALSTSHTFTLSVYGLKLEYDPSVDEPDGQTPFIDSDYVGSSYDGILDARDASYFGGLLMWPSDPQMVQFFDDKIKLYYQHKDGVFPADLDNDGVIEADNNGSLPGGVDERGTVQIKVAGKWLTLSFEGAYTRYDYNDNGYFELFAGVPGIYLPLAGKTVTFTKANEAGSDLSNLGAFFDGADVKTVASASPTTPVVVVTDASGHASITVANPAGGGSGQKGPETVRAVVDWVGNPHDGPELQTAYAKKNWVAGVTASATDVTIEVYIDGELVASNKKGEVAVGKSAAWITDTNGDRLLNSAHVEVHVLDVYGNDLPDYEVVYLLEDINGWLGGTQSAYHTYIPWAFLADLDTDDYDATTDTFYDTNGDAPDSDEPTSGSDPYAYIVGAGGTPAFFFNQWLGSEKGVGAGYPGLASWYARVAGLGFLAYYGDIDHVAYTYTWPRYPEPVDPEVVFNGFDLVLENVTPPALPLAPTELGLATDGAKAWTLDGYFIPEQSTEVRANLLTGSNLDIQLADDITGAGEDSIHVKSILRVMVYAPYDGLVTEGDYIWSYQVHQVWEEPVPTAITLAVTPDYAIAGLEFQTLTATVLDQFGDPMPNVELTVDSTKLEGNFTPQFTAATALPTDENGNVVIGPWMQPAGRWGVERVVATAGAATSNAALIQWIYDDTWSAGTGRLDIDGLGTTFYGPNLVQGTQGASSVAVSSGFTPWNGRALLVFAAPGGSAISAARTYVSSSSLSITTTAALGTAFFVNASNSTNTDGRPNWIYDVSLPTP
jgi:hypothetical protein